MSYITLFDIFNKTKNDYQLGYQNADKFLKKAGNQDSDFIVSVIVFVWIMGVFYLIQGWTGLLVFDRACDVLQWVGEAIWNLIVKLFNWIVF